MCVKVKCFATLDRGTLDGAPSMAVSLRSIIDEHVQRHWAARDGESDLEPTMGESNAGPWL